MVLEKRQRINEFVALLSNTTLCKFADRDRTFDRFPERIFGWGCDNPTTPDGMGLCNSGSQKLRVCLNHELPIMNTRHYSTRIASLAQLPTHWLFNIFEALLLE